MKTYFSIFLLVCGTIVMGQPSVGKKFINGSISLNGQHTRYPDISNISYDYFYSAVNLNYGKFISENSAIGITGGVSFSFSKQNSAGTNPTQLKTWTPELSVGFLYERYFKLTDKFYLNLSSSLSVSNSLEKYRYTISGTDLNSHSSTIGATLSIRPGIFWFFKPDMALNLRFGNLFYNVDFAMSEYFGEVDSINQNYGLSLTNSGLSFGFTKFF